MITVQINIEGTIPEVLKQLQAAQAQLGGEDQEKKVTAALVEYGIACSEGRRIAGIKAVRDILPVDLKKAKEIIERVPALGEKRWIIANFSLSLWWSEEDQDWTRDRNRATRYNDWEKARTDMDPEGAWVSANSPRRPPKYSWIIISREGKGWWSDTKRAWVLDRDEATRYTDWERDNYPTSLEPGAEWVRPE